MSATFEFLGLDLSSRVVEWGEIEQIKEVFLAEPQIFTGQVSISVDNSDNAFSEFNSQSVVKGVKWYNEVATITEDGVVLFQGFIKNIKVSKQARIATFDIENIFSKPSEIFFVGSATGVNPADALKSVLAYAGLDDYIDDVSFSNAGALARLNGATINYSYVDTDNTTILSVINEISKLTSITIVITDGKFRAQSYQAYQGDSSQLKNTIDNSAILKVNGFYYDVDRFSNQVTIKYGAASSYQASDAKSIHDNKVTRNAVFNTTTSERLSVPDLASATFFAERFLLRNKNRVNICELQLGEENKKTQPGDRHPLTIPFYGLNESPYEVIQTKRTINSDSVDIVAFSLEG